MSEVVINQLPVATTIAGNDLLAVYVRSGSGTYTVSRITGTNFATGALSGFTGSTSIVTLGTIATGTWQGSIIGPTYLGTGSAISTKFLRGDGTWQTVTSGSGDVVGPASATDGVMALFDGTTGKLIKAGAAPFDPTAPGPIGGTTPSTIAGTTLAISGVTSLFNARLYIDGERLFIPAELKFNTGSAFGTNLTSLYAAANTLALRNLGNSQRFQITGDYTDDSNNWGAQVRTGFGDVIFEFFASGTGSGSINTMIISGNGASGIEFETGQTRRLKIKANGIINIVSIPTSSSGLASGDVWSNSNVLTIVP